MIGVTGYNTGTYYREVFGEEWRDFEDIYNHIENEYQTYFSNYPWIITEFASSSYGGDKAKWISDMFLHLDKYENIKIAVWYSCPDMDFRPEYEGKIARPYMLDETPETLEAFKEGLHDYLGT
ncbi:Endoglucanase H [bioreactor metagenome]|uniref:Endoglucanase H n=1 Tax=bioreactor metagenome TaxID=1076179 RepID=A0A644YXB2_9ZZZZ